MYYLKELSRGFQTQKLLRGFDDTTKRNLIGLLKNKLIT